MNILSAAENCIAIGRDLWYNFSKQEQEILKQKEKGD